MNNSDIDIVVLDNLGTNDEGNEVRLVRIEQNGESYEAEMTVQRWLDISTKYEPSHFVPMEYSIKRIEHPMAEIAKIPVMLDLKYNGVTEVYELV